MDKDLPGTLIVYAMYQKNILSTRPWNSDAASSRMSGTTENVWYDNDFGVNCTKGLFSCECCRVCALLEEGLRVRGLQQSSRPTSVANSAQRQAFSSGSCSPKVAINTRAENTCTIYRSLRSTALSLSLSLSSSPLVAAGVNLQNRTESHCTDFR